MFSKKFLKNEIYCISLNNKNTLVYAPLTRFFAIYKGSITKKEIINDLATEAYSPDKIPDFIKERGFIFDTNKIRLRLNITSGCNLHCSYCSVNADSDINTIENMPNSTAFIAIRFFIDYAIKNKSKELEIVFSGGEPTLKIKQIKEIINFTLDKAKDKSLKISFRLITNGLFSQDEMDQVANYFREIQISWDGIFSSHPRYGKHYKILGNNVLKNISWLLKRNITVSVLTVISEHNYQVIYRVVKTLYNLGVRHIFLSLENNLGRATKCKKNIDLKILALLYVRLWKFYRKMGMDINLAGTDIHSISPFPCSVPIPNYSISPKGIISSCTTTFNDNSKIVDDFEIGSIHNSTVFLNKNSIKRMRRFQVVNIPECSNCFAKWHCRGGCIYAKQGNWFSTLPTPICSLIRNIIREKLLFIIRE